ncbi:MAG: enoyl-CoA hydratase/isomerase family protein [Gammaproteobacteria bacterium]|nr:enoyl-CoA hydratase/isomerase family protein [Gammaproteobacteria bacterium]
MSEVVSYARDGRIAIIMVDNPPVNALSLPVRQGLAQSFQTFMADPAALAAVLICNGRTFIAGADITEFDKPIEEPWLPKVIHQIEDCTKPVVAAIHGTALGGGLETAMACHYRVAVASAQVGLPEVSLGLLPGATGTQRLPRLAGVRTALDAMISGKPLSAAAAHQKGIVDQVIDGDLKAGAVAFAEELLKGGKGPRVIRNIKIDAASLTPNFFADYRKSIARDTRGFFAPEQIVKCVEAAVSLPYFDAVKRENELFMQCMNSSQSKAQRHLFFAEREVAKIPDVPKDTPARTIKKVAVVGGGTMGGGIAMNFANVGIPVILKEVNQEALDRGMNIIRSNYEGPVKKGKLSQAQMDKCMALIQPTLNYADLSDADLVIEAVFETMAVKMEVFGKLDEVCKVGAILASNTSTLNVDEIAASTKRPADVIGLHFFAPANVMTLLEIVRGAKTAKDVVATCMALAKTIRKMGVLVRVCFGFVGNRMYFPYIREAQRMMLEGVAPERLDRVVYEWGMAMGPHGVSDLSGLDVFDKLNKEWKDKPNDPAYCRMIGLLVAKGRLGQKSGAGIYKYEGRNPVPDPEVMKLARQEATALKIPQLEISDEEIIERLFIAMINEGALILDEGIAMRPSDIDVVYCHGYGMPRYRGGPMQYADSLGLGRVHSAMQKYRARYGDLYWTPAPLIEKLAKSGKTFAQWNAERG